MSKPPLATSDDNESSTRDATVSTGKRDPVEQAILQAARRIVEFLVLAMVSITFFMKGPFWYLPPFFRVFMAVILSASLFLVYAAVLRYLRDRNNKNAVVNPANGILAVDDSQRSIAMRTFRVPQNFGIQTIVLATFAFAILTAILKSFEVTPVVSMAVIGYVTCICAMQIFMNQVPRVASSVTGLMFGVGLAFNYYHKLDLVFSQVPLPDFVSPMFLELFIALVIGTSLGVLVGYATGTLVAGIFLFTDASIEWWHEGSGEQVTKRI